LGQPQIEGGLPNNENDNITVHHNRILSNGGLFFAGAVGIFNGADNYDFGFNDMCGNFSQEYGGAISHFGLSPNGKIHDNLMYFNTAFDEGGAMVAGEYPAGQPGALGSGPVDITHNLIEDNLSNDDGGGIRLLRPLTSPVNIVNNIIDRNVATDFGGGIALDDASAVTIVNNTIADNISTATAEDADKLLQSAAAADHLSPAPVSLAKTTQRPSGHAAWARPRSPTGCSTTSSGTTRPSVGWGAAVYRHDRPGGVRRRGRSANFSLLSVPYPGSASNIVEADPLFVHPIPSTSW
jgi:hypothetical protein